MQIGLCIGKYAHSITLIYNSIQIDYTISQITTDETSFRMSKKFS